MKIRHHIAALSMALATAAAPLITGCSDNVEQGLYPDSGSHISLSAAPASAEVASGFHNGQLDLGSARSETEFKVTSTTRWIVEITNCEGAWCQITYGDNTTDASGQIGDGTFVIDAAPNHSLEYRTCDVTVRAVDAEGTPLAGVSQDIHLRQDPQSIDIASTISVISPYGTTSASEPTVTVKANQAWTVSTTHPWVTIVPGTGMDGDSFTPAVGSVAEQTVSFRISVAPNPGTAARTAEVIVSSPSSAFTPQRLNVTQEGSTETFIVTPTVVPVVSHMGTVLEFQVYSPRDSWSVFAVADGGWITVEPTGGAATEAPVTVRASVSANSNGTARDASLVFSHGEGADAVQLPVAIAQSGNPEAPDPDHTPVVSAPWLEGGWTASHARIYAYFRSPIVDLAGCGVYLTSASGTLTFEGSFYGNELMAVDISGLQSATTYEAVAFVRYYMDGTLRESVGSSIYFTIPGQSGEPGKDPVVPNPGDNTPPSPDTN